MIIISKEPPKRVMSQSSQIEVRVEIRWIVPRSAEAMPQLSIIEYIEDIEDIEDVEDIEDIEDFEDVADIEDIEDIEDVEDTENIDDIEDVENVEDVSFNSLEFSQHSILEHVCTL